MNSIKIVFHKNLKDGEKSVDLIPKLPNNFSEIVRVISAFRFLMAKAMTYSCMVMIS